MVLYKLFRSVELHVKGAISGTLFDKRESFRHALPNLRYDTFRHTDNVCQTGQSARVIDCHVLQNDGQYCTLLRDFGHTPGPNPHHLRHSRPR